MSFYNKLSLSQRIFGAMFLVLLFTSVSILFITIYHFRAQTQKYHEDSLRRKERAALTAFDYEMEKYPEMVTDANVYSILEDTYLVVADVNNIDINVFDIRGNLMFSTEPDGVKNKLLPTSVLDSLNTKLDYLEVPDSDGSSGYMTTYSYLRNIQNQPVAIINLPYRSNNSFFKEEMLSLLKRFGGVMLFILVVGGYLSWVMANQITRKLRAIASKMEQTQVMASNNPIAYNNNDEIKVLVDSYNQMLLKLNQQSQLLAQTEREDAWREMAKQVAHEIKNPLTPMRLLIQSFARRFNPNAEGLIEKVKDLSDALITQIDTMSSIAEAFSDFAKMPIRKDEVIDIVNTIESTLEIFPDSLVRFVSKETKLYLPFDKIYLSRMIINLAKNALQAIPATRKPNVLITLQKTRKIIVINVTDNGVGIPKEVGNKVFEPKFTTTTGGMGLGLAMVKKIVEEYNGEISFISEEGKGTTFSIKLPWNEQVI